MNIEIITYQRVDLSDMRRIWNAIIADANAFAETEPYDEISFQNMVEEQSAVRCLFVDDKLVGLYILHPNREGRLAHIANASYAIDKDYRGKGFGRLLVNDSLAIASELGFIGFQFNAVICDNVAAVRLYERVGFQKVGIVPKGYRKGDGRYSDIFIMYKSLVDDM